MSDDVLGDLRRFRDQARAQIGTARTIQEPQTGSIRATQPVQTASGASASSALAPDAPAADIEITVYGTQPPDPPAPTEDPGIPDDVGISIGGRQFRGWQEVRVTRGIERVPADFDLVTTERFLDASKIDIRPGQECVVDIEGDLVLTGYVDRYAPSLDVGAHKVVFSGRSKSADLVDCSAIFEDEFGQETAGQLMAASTRALVARLARPYGVAVVALDGDGIQIPQFNALLTETPYEIIERVTRYSRMLAYDDPEGQLVLAQVGTKSHASGFQQGVNVERASVVFAMDQRFSQYDVLLTPMNLLGDVTAAASGSPSWNRVSRVEDKEVPRRRRRVIIVEQMQGGEQLAKDRAEWEKARRYGRSQAIRLTVDSWRDRAGKLWEPNTKARIDVPALKVSGQDWIISEVTYRRGADGTHADIILMPPEAFQPAPVILAPFDSQVYRDINGQQP